MPTEEADRLEQEAARLARQNKGKRGYKQEAQKVGSRAVLLRFESMLTSTRVQRKEARRSIWDGKRFVGSEAARLNSQHVGRADSVSHRHLRLQGRRRA